MRRGFSLFAVATVLLASSLRGAMADGIGSQANCCASCFSLMNDLKTTERSNLAPETLKNLMIWNYYGKKMSVEQLPATQILQEWYKVCAEAGIRSVPMARPEQSGSGVRQSPAPAPAPALAPAYALAPAPASGSSGSGGDRRANQGGSSSDDDVDGLAAGGHFAWLDEGST